MACSILRESLGSNQAFLAIDEISVRYLSRFACSDAYFLLSKEDAVLLTDGRYIEAAEKAQKGFRAISSMGHIKAVISLCKEQGINEVFTETGVISFKSFEKIKSALDPEGIKLLDSPDLENTLLSLRSVKTEDEINSIRAAQSITDQTFSYILPRIETGRTEREIMLDMEFFSRRLGSEGVAFDFIVVSGENTSLPHGVPTERKVKKGDFITMDFGAVVNGYRSDMTRTVAIGSVSDEQRLVYNTVLEANLTALDFVRAGVTGKAADASARDIISKAGFGEYFGHSLGHGVGLEIHEAPNLSSRYEAPLKAGQVVTIEPGIYLPNKFGVRIEDMVIVTDGGVENLTKSSKELIIL